VIIRNLYTGDTTVTQAGVNGSFGAELYGPANTPFWISPTTDNPNAQLDQIGSLPGGPGTIVYGALAQASLVSEPVTTLVVDGEFVDWNAYTNSLTAQGVRALYNQDALYLGFPDGFLLENTTQIIITLTADAAQFSLSMLRDQIGALSVTRLDPAVRELGTVGVASAGTTAVEVRIRLAALNPDNPQPQVVTLRQVEQRSAAGASLRTTTVDEAALFVQERVGVVRDNPSSEGTTTRFSIAGAAAGDELRWSARAQLATQDLQPGDTLRLQMDVTLDAPTLPDGVIGLTLGARFYLQPVVNGSGDQAAGGLYSNTGWSGRLTPSGIGIGNLRSDQLLGEAITSTPLIARRADQLLFPLDFEVALPKDLPAGLYTLMLEGFGQVGDGDRFSWQENSPLGTGSALPVSAWSRLPAVLNIGGVSEGHLLWSLFQNTPSNGVRGLLTTADQAQYGMTNAVRYSSPVYILPPSRNGEVLAYSLEPYLLNMLPNRYDLTTAPLLPLLFPGGRLSAQITRPDGVVDDLGSVPIVQSRLSTAALDEAERFGSQSLVDVYQISTLNPLFSQYQFSQYGDHEILLQGEMEDVWGNRYTGGGTYTVRIAEPLTISPAVLPGSPFTVGDVLAAGVRVSPGLPAQVRMRVQVFPLDGSPMVEQIIEGRANAHGYFAASTPHFLFEQAGEYVIDYEVEYLDNNAQLWAGSLRSAGVVAADVPVSAGGDRGLVNNGDGPRPAWFRAQGYAPAVENPIMPLPFFSGDVLWLPDEDGLLQTTLTVQNGDPAYLDWLRELERVDEDRLAQLTVEAALPLEASLSATPAEAYTYLSAVTPGFSLRQQVQGSQYGGANLPLTTDDPAAGQNGAGSAGLRPGDYVFLFGGSIQREPAVTEPQAAGYAALAVITTPDDPLGPRVLPPFQGEAGGGNAGPLFTLQERPIRLFFHPTGIVPGSILTVGDTFSVAGQFGPTLDSTLHVRIISPTGVIREFEGQANATGYYYDPAQDFTVLEAGLWTVELHGQHAGRASNGMVEEPAPTGDVLGTVDGLFSVYVLPTGTPLLEWNDTRTDFVIPAGQPYNFRFTLPEGWTDAQFHYTVSIPGLVLEQGPIRVVGQSVTYQYNLGTLRQTFPMLEDGRSGEGASAIDTVTLSFFASGTDASGQRQRLGRSFTIAFDRLTTSG
jgi:hypothetical protein